MSIPYCALAWSASALHIFGPPFHNIIESVFFVVSKHGATLTFEKVLQRLWSFGQHRGSNFFTFIVAHFSTHVTAAGVLRLNKSEVFPLQIMGQQDLTYLWGLGRHSHCTFGSSLVLRTLGFESVSFAINFSDIAGHNTSPNFRRGGDFLLWLWWILLDSVWQHPSLHFFFVGEGYALFPLPFRRGRTVAEGDLELGFVPQSFSPHPI